MASSSPPRNTARHPGILRPGPDTPLPHLRAARGADAAALTGLAIRAKAYWGYDAAFLEACRVELAVSREQIGDRSRRYTVAESNTAPVGFSTLVPGDDDTTDLDALFVEPNWIGRGIGRFLLEDTLRQARLLGGRMLRVESDPGAVGFYLKAGGRQAGTAPSGCIPGRQLPVVLFSLRKAAP